MKSGGAARRKVALNEVADGAHQRMGHIGLGKITDSALVHTSQLAWLTRPEETESSELMLKAEDAAARLLVFAGRPLREFRISQAKLLKTLEQGIPSLSAQPITLKQPAPKTCEMESGTIN